MPSSFHPPSPRRKPSLSLSKPLLHRTLKCSSPSPRWKPQSQNGGGGGWVLDALVEFRRLCKNLRPPPNKRVDHMAANILRDEGQWPLAGADPALGTVPGIDVGAEFYYRLELFLVGLHRPPECGIDYQKCSGLATSVVASGGYRDCWNFVGDVLIYTGSGGFGERRKTEPRDQKMEKGNLALKRSMEAKSPVRVIYGFRDFNGSTASVFVYDGLYVVENYQRVKGKNGFFVFEFHLRRKPGQPLCPRKEVEFEKMSRASKKRAFGCASRP